MGIYLYILIPIIMSMLFSFQEIADVSDYSGDVIVISDNLKKRTSKAIMGRKISSGDIIKTFKNSCVIKPANEGSSIGMTIIDNDLSVEKLKNGLNTCLNISEKIIIEEYIGGRELTVSILGDRTLPIIEIFPTNQYFIFIL